MKAEGTGKPYDCVLGHGAPRSDLGARLGLRPLVVHVDAGWNSELTGHSTERFVKHRECELHSHAETPNGPPRGSWHPSEPHPSGEKLAFGGHVATIAGGRIRWSTTRSSVAPRMPSGIRSCVNPITPFPPLNLMHYSKERAIEELRQIDWRAYPREHGELPLAKFFQNRYLPTRPGYDKRRPHYGA